MQYVIAAISLAMLFFSTEAANYSDFVKAINYGMAAIVFAIFSTWRD